MITCTRCGGEGMIATDQDDKVCPRCRGAGVEGPIDDTSAQPDPTTGRNVLQRATGGNVGAFRRGSVMRKIAEAVALETDVEFGLIKAVLVLAGEIDRDREERNHGNRKD